ncbi:pyridoxamine 5'-phosphate oxidase [Anoxybacterium hadale]|uniref:Pyridoxamine 5'-phosphate oxidase n=1 Tax=Anoxybacterium hadale TaxID=3408580 RepID=A0ACD1ABK5_9FIRM|nr:pyridoxamine 5'-phosphate oxidase [Clostridiales bacterium]
MNELLTEVLLFANQNPSSWLATCEGDQPRVRGMLLWFADETGFYYHTAKAKSLYSQMKENPKMEAAFIRNADQPEFEMLRVTGTVEILNDQALEERLKEERAWLWGNVQQSEVNTEVVIFRISHGSAYIWNMAWNVKEAEAPRVEF